MHQWTNFPADYFKPIEFFRVIVLPSSYKRNIMTLAEIITIGDEILIGQIVDTNSAWMGQRLNEIGIKVKQITSVSDDRQHILNALKEAHRRADVILITGGLGPTKDDITKKTLCDYFGAGWKFDAPTLAIIEEIFAARGRTVSEVNRKQAEVPDCCTVLLNKRGTAPGMWFEHDGRIYVSMPGVPGEMKGLMESAVIPELKKRFLLPPIVHKTILTQGIGESMLAEKIEKWEDALPSHIKLAYLPSAGMVRLRLTAMGSNEQELLNEVQAQASKVLPLIDEFVFGYEEDKLEVIVGNLLRGKKKTLATAESCTGGSIAARIVTVPGSSDYYQGSVVAYANNVKKQVLKVDQSLIEAHGAVSEPVVRHMAEEVKKLLNADYSIATSGIAGPTGGTAEKPVGTVWLAVSGPDRTITRKLQLGSMRERIIMEAGHHGLNELRKMLLSSGSEPSSN